jgi:hypothetical protein
MATWNINLLQLPNSHPRGYKPEFIRVGKKLSLNLLARSIQGKQFAFHFQQSFKLFNPTNYRPRLLTNSSSPSTLSTPGTSTIYTLPARSLILSGRRPFFMTCV